ncbi:MAG: pilus assembly protein [Proteobacteria bacterium]|nr:pilus assembly protein [Pseudomonadota bacterium]
MESRFAKACNKARQAGQGMTEYIIIVAVIAVASIAVYSYFGDTLRYQTAAAAKALSGQDGAAETSNAQSKANTAADSNTTERKLADFAEDR